MSVRTPVIITIDAGTTSVVNATGAGYAAFGTVVDIEGYGGMSLKIEKEAGAGTDDVLVKVFVEDDYDATEPSVSTGMHLVRTAIQTLDISDHLNQSIDLTGISGKYLLIEAVASGTDADIKIKVELHGHETTRKPLRLVIDPGTVAINADGSGYAITGVTVNVAGFRDICLHVEKEAGAGSDDVNVQVYDEPDLSVTTAPTALTNMHLTSEAGTPTTLTLDISADTEGCFACPTQATKWLGVAQKASGTDADIKSKVVVTANAGGDED